MSEENVEALNAELLRGTVGTSMRRWRWSTPRWRWHAVCSGELEGELNDLPETRGIPANCFRDVHEAFVGAPRIEISETRDLGERIVAIGHLRGRGKGKRGRGRDRQSRYVDGVQERQD